jgi:hypothetical protein
MAARRASQRMGWAGAGTCMPVRCAWVEIDPEKQMLHVLQRSFPVPAGDSTLVVLVDDVDQQTPTVETFVIATSPRTGRDIPADDTAQIFSEIGEDAEHFRAIARAEPRINRFVGEWEECPPVLERRSARDRRPRR